MNIDSKFSTKYYLIESSNIEKEKYTTSKWVYSKDAKLAHYLKINQCDKQSKRRKTYGSHQLKQKKHLINSIPFLKNKTFNKLGTERNSFYLIECLQKSYN